VVRVYADASLRIDRATVAVVVVERGHAEIVRLRSVKVNNSNEAECIAFLEAIKVAPRGAVVFTDSGRVQALLRQRILPKAYEEGWLSECLTLIEEKNLSWGFIGGKRRRRKRSHRKGFSLADKASKAHTD